MNEETAEDDFFSYARGYGKENKMKPFFAVCGNKVQRCLAVFEGLVSPSLQAVLEKEIQDVEQAYDDE